MTKFCLSAKVKKKTWKNGSFEVMRASSCHGIIKKNPAKQLVLRIYHLPHISSTPQPDETDMHRGSYIQISRTWN